MIITPVKTAIPAIISVTGFVNNPNKAVETPPIPNCNATIAVSSIPAPTAAEYIDVKNLIAIKGIMINIALPNPPKADIVLPIAFTKFVKPVIAPLMASEDMSSIQIF